MRLVSVNWTTRMPSNAAVPNLFGAVSQKTIFPLTRVQAGGLGIRHITCIVHFVSIIVTSAPPQIIGHLILEVGDPCFKGQTGPPCSWEVDSSAQTGELAPDGYSHRLRVPTRHGGPSRNRGGHELGGFLFSSPFPPHLQGFSLCRHPPSTPAPRTP